MIRQPARTTRRTAGPVRTLAALLLLSLAGCSLHKVREDVPPPVAVPERLAGAGEAEAYVDRWWEAFATPALDRQVELALAGNLELGQAWARLDQASALARQAAAGQWPEISLTAGLGRLQSVFSAGPPIGTRSVQTDRVPLTVGAAYEVDLWRRIASLKRGAVLDSEASRQDLESIAMTLAAQVVETWFTLAEQHSRIDLLQAQLRAGGTFLELTELRFAQGLASALDVYQQRQQVAATRSELPAARASRAVARNQLAVLLGRSPGMDLEDDARALPVMPPLPPTGLTADLLARRPDVRSAQLRVASADHRVAAAIAARLPALRIGGDTGLESHDINELDNMLDYWVWSIMANLTWPVFDGGRRKAEVDRTRAVVAERLAAFGQTVLVAVREVEDALVQEHEQLQLVRDLQRQTELARSTLREARMRYMNGLSDYLPVLTALQSLQVLERSELTARHRLLSFRVQLYRSLGGAWTSELTPPDRSSADTPTEPRE